MTQVDRSVLSYIPYCTILLNRQSPSLLAMALEGEEIHTAVAEVEPSSTPSPDAQKEKSSPAVTITEDNISPANNTEPENSAVCRAETIEETPSESKKSNVHVHVSRRSTETGDSKTSKRRFVMRWPTKELGPGVHWYAPTMMILLALAGLFGGLGHHLYNARLDGQPVVDDDAQWPQRWGVAMAFFVKMTLVGAVQMAVKQRAWVSSTMEDMPPRVTG